MKISISVCRFLIFCVVFVFLFVGQDVYAEKACKCGDKCYKFGEKMGTGLTDAVASKGQCGTCKEVESYDICSRSISPKSGTEQGSGGPEFIMPDASVLNKLGTTHISIILGRIIKAAMGIMGSIALVMIVYGGVLWMTAGGSAEKNSKAMQILVWSSLGIVLIFASYAVVDIVFEAFR